MGGVVAGVLTGLQAVASIATAAFNALGAALGVVNQALGILAEMLTITLRAMEMVVEVVYIAFEVFEGLFLVVSSVVGAFFSLGTTVTETTGIISDSNEEIEEQQSVIGSIIKGTIGTVIALGAAMVASAVGSSLAWEPVVDRLARMKLIIGDAIGEIRKQVESLGPALAKSGGELLKLAEKAAFLGIPAANIRDVTLAAEGLAAALGIKDSEALSKLEKALHNNMDGLEELIPKLEGVTDRSERMKIVMEIATKGLELQRDRMGTLSGLWDSFKSTLADNAAVFGERIAPGIKLIVEALRPLLGMLGGGSGLASLFNKAAQIIAPAITAMIEGIGYLQSAFTVAWNEIFALIFGANAQLIDMDAIIKSVADGVIAAMKMLGQGIVYAIAAMSTLVQFAPEIWQSIVDIVAWASTKIVDWVKWVFLEAIPEILQTAAVPLGDIVNQIFQYMLSVVSSVMSTLIVFFAKAWWKLFTNVLPVVRQGIEAIAVEFTKGFANMIIDFNLGIDRRLNKAMGGMFTRLLNLVESFKKSLKTALGTEEETDWTATMKGAVDDAIKSASADLKELTANTDFRVPLPSIVMPEMPSLPSLEGPGESKGAEEARKKMEDSAADIGDLFGGISSGLMSKFDDLNKLLPEIVPGKGGLPELPEIGKLPQLKEKEGKADSGSTQNLLESRFLVRGATGITPELRQAITQTELAKQLLEEARKRAEFEARMTETMGQLQVYLGKTIPVGVIGGGAF